LADLTGRSNEEPGQNRRRGLPAFRHGEGLFAISLIFFLLLAGCPLEMGEDIVQPGNRNESDAGANTLIANYNLQAYVPVPVAGETPVREIRSRADVEVEVAWYRETTPNANSWDPLAAESSFETGVKYGADITLRAMKGFRFASTRSFRYELPAVVELQPDENNGSSERALTRVYYKAAAQAATVDYFDLTNRVPAPMAGSTPVSSITGAGQYTAMVTWTKADDSPVEPGDFLPQTAYKAKLRLTAASGYVFGAPAETRFFHLGSNPATDGSSAAASLAFTELTPARKAGELTITFPATTAVKAALVTDRDLTSKIPAPVKGGMPEQYISSSQYMGTISWSPADSVFQSNTTYTATAALTAVSGCTFTGIPANAFSHRGADQRIRSNPANTAGSGAVTIVFPATTTMKAVSVTDLDLTHKVPTPVSGGTPAPLIAAPQYKGTISWSPADSVFQAGKAYTATVTLAAASGYTFTGVKADSFIHNGKDGAATRSLVNAADSGTVTIVFPATTTVKAVPVTDLDLTGKIPAPVRGSTPVIYVSGSQYTGIVNWTSGASLDTPLTDIFDGGTAYTATVTLIAASGYTFTGVGENAFRHNGKDGAVTPNPANPADSGTVTMVFPSTAAVTALKVSDLDLSSKLPRPVPGATPKLYLSTPQYSGVVNWFPAHGIFRADIAYTATITLTAASGYTFTGVGANAFSHNGKDGSVTPNPSNPVSRGKVTIKFPMTMSGNLAKVTNLDLTKWIPVPEVGATAITSFASPQYIGSVKWSPAVGIFRNSTKYTAELTLMAASGYSFEGIPLSGKGFVHTGAAAGEVSSDFDSDHPGDTRWRLVTIVFPDTAPMVISDYNLQNYVPIPEKGKKPAATISRLGIDAKASSVKWTSNPPDASMEKDPDYSFISDKEYLAEITLVAAHGYIFDSEQTFVYPYNDVDAHVQDSSSMTHVTKRSFLVSYTNLLEVEGFANPKGRSAIDKIIANSRQAAVYVEIKPGNESAALGTDSLPSDGFIMRRYSTSPEVVTIDGNNREVTLGGTLSNERPLITVDNRVTLILRDITLRGSTSNTAPLIKVLRGGTLILEKGAVITGNTNNGRGADDAGGILINGGKLELNGGIISGHSTAKSNAAGGVAMDWTGGTFIMKSGAISGNTATGPNSGGAVRMRSGKFTMEGGTISGNTGGVFLVEWGEFVMTDGTIKENTGGNGDLFVSAKAFISGGSIETLKVDEGKIVDLKEGSGSWKVNRIELKATPTRNNHAQIRITGVLPSGAVIDVVSYDSQSNQVFDRRTLYGQLGTKSLLLGSTGENYLKFTYDGTPKVFASDGRVTP
jgi:hypothetical protein